MHPNIRSESLLKIINQKESNASEKTYQCLKNKLVKNREWIIGSWAWAAMALPAVLTA
jgi:hypothetical protein